MIPTLIAILEETYQLIAASGVSQGMVKITSIQQEV
jgi:hypothetical protein